MGKSYHLQASFLHFCNGANTIMGLSYILTKLFWWSNAITWVTRRLQPPSFLPPAKDMVMVIDGHDQSNTRMTTAHHHSLRAHLMTQMTWWSLLYQLTQWCQIISFSAGKLEVIIFFYILHSILKKALHTQRKNISKGKNRASRISWTCFQIQPYHF